MHFNQLKANCQTKKNQPVVFIFQWQNFCSGNAAAKMFTVRKKERKKEKPYSKNTGQVYTTTYSIYYSIKQVLSCFKTLFNKSQEFPFCKVPESK